MIVLQVAVFIGMPLYLEEYMTYIYGATTILEVVILIYIINSEGNPAFKMTWMLCAGVSDYRNAVLSVCEDAVWIPLYGASPGKTSD